MIPKIIHYCWIGPNGMPDIVKKCVESWKRVMPDYEIKFWDESNLPIQAYNFMKDAYELKMWAFVSDYARYWILKQYGGFFLDTDVEVIKPFDDFLNHKVMFGFNKHVKKNVFFVNPGLIIGAEMNNNLISEILSLYDTLNFVTNDGTANTRLSSPRVLTKYLIENRGLIIKDIFQELEGNIKIYPTEYFDPINPRIIFGNKMELTENTHAIHYGTGTWVGKSKKVKLYLSIISRNILGDTLIDKIRGKEKM